MNTYRYMGISIRQFLNSIYIPRTPSITADPYPLPYSHRSVILYCTNVMYSLFTQGWVLPRKSIKVVTLILIFRKL